MQYFYFRVSLGEKVAHDDDYLCSTAMAVNALLYTWMDGDRLSPDVPFQVKTVVVGASKWLMKYAKQMPAKSVVFSGSVKSTEVSAAHHPSLAKTDHNCYFCFSSCRIFLFSILTTLPD